jgi:hypothetical protein
MPSRDTFDSVGVPELVGCEPAAHAGGQRGPVQLQADRDRRARPAAGWLRKSQSSADRQGPAQLVPGFELLPRPAVHPDPRVATIPTRMWRPVKKPVRGVR